MFTGRKYPRAKPLPLMTWMHAQRDDPIGFGSPVWRPRNKTRHHAVFIRRPGSPTPRNVFSEWFVIDDAKIRTIYTAMFYPPPDLAVPNWPPYDGNWPLPSGIVPAPAPPRQP